MDRPVRVLIWLLPLAVILPTLQLASPDLISAGEARLPTFVASTAWPSANPAKATNSHHYGQEFAALVLQFNSQRSAHQVGAFAITPLPNDQQRSPLKRKHHFNDKSTALSLVRIAKAQVHKGLLHLARRSALKCLDLKVRHLECLHLLLSTSNSLGLDTDIEGGLQRSRAILDAIFQWFVEGKSEDDWESIDRKADRQANPFRPFTNDAIFPLTRVDYRKVLYNYMMSLLNLDDGEAYHAVFNATKNITGWRHPFQISLSDTDAFLSKSELESGHMKMPRPFWPASNFPQIQKVLEEEVYPALVEELPMVPESAWVEHEETTLKSGTFGWQEIRLCKMDESLWSEKRCRLLPKVCAALQRNGLFAQRITSVSSSMDELNDYADNDVTSQGPPDNEPISFGVPGRLSLLRLPPGSSLVAHTGPFNERLSFYMGVSLPPPIEIAQGVPSFMESASMTVANQTVRWQLGKAMFWDDSFVHSVRNDHPTQSRVVFTGHIFKPSFTDGSTGWELVDQSGIGQTNGAPIEYGSLDDEFEREKTENIEGSPQLPDEDDLVWNHQCRMHNGDAEFRAATSAAATAADGTPSSFLDTLVYHVEHTIDPLSLQMMVTEGEADWMATWAEHAEGPNARPFTATGLMPWWRPEGDLFAPVDDDDLDVSPMREFSCAELVRVFGHLKANYQRYSGGWIPGSEEELVNDLDYDWQDGFQLRTIAKRIPSCAVNQTWTQEQQRKLSKKMLGRDENEIGSTPAPVWFKTNSSSHGAAQLRRDLHRAGFGQRTPAYLMGTRFVSEWGELLRKLYRKGILTEVAELTEGVDRTEDKFYRTPLNSFAARSTFARDQHFLRTEEARDSEMPLSTAPTLLELHRGLSLDEVFLYIGDKFSGTFFHQHGTVCSMSSTAEKSSPRLWMLYPPHTSTTSPHYCILNGSLPSHLPKFCGRHKMENKRSNCMEELHPVDFVQHYWELYALGKSPLLHVQRPGETFCIPEGWYHAVLNLGPSVSVALKLHHLVRVVGFILFVSFVT